MNQDLLYALLAMDVYHRGPVGGLRSVVPETQIDDTTRDLDAESAANNAIGFFAQSYLHEGQRIIVYRGTDDGGANFWDIAGGLIGLGGTLDTRNGYSIGFGAYTNPQAQAAIAFYQSFLEGASPINSGMTVVGQSLGGGLAGYVESLWSTDVLIRLNAVRDRSQPCL